MSETVSIVVASTEDAVGVTVAGGDALTLAVSAPVEAVSLAVQPESDAVAVAVAETLEQVSFTAAPAGESVAVAIADQGDTVTLVVGEAESQLRWSDLVTQWDVAPSLWATILQGSVYAYTLDGVTRYRLVPAPYVPSADAFYSTFAGGVLTNPVAARG